MHKMLICICLYTLTSKLYTFMYVYLNGHNLGLHLSLLTLINYNNSCFILFLVSKFGFTDERLSVIATFTMLLGEINRGDIFNARIDLEPFAMLTELIFCIFIFLMPMVLANLTVCIRCHGDNVAENVGMVIRMFVLIFSFGQLIFPEIERCP